MLLFSRFCLLALFICHASSFTSLDDSTARFAVNLYEAVSPDESGNIIISPFSAFAILAMAALGAKGQTATEMYAGLDLTGSSPSSLSTGFHSLLAPFQSNSSVLKVANKIYIQQGNQIKPTFKALATKDFYSSAQTLNFNNAGAAANTINKWVASETDDLIQNLVSPDALSADTEVVLVNAIYFNGKWDSPFESYQTYQQQFYPSHSSSINIDFMHATSNYNYADIPKLNAQLLQIPYQNGDYSFNILLPRSATGITALEHDFKTVDLLSIRNQLSYQNVYLALPKFNSTLSATLNSPLKKLGMKTMFTNAADFTGLIGENVKISSVVQKAFIEVNEAGTKAAAATAMFAVADSIFEPIDPPINFICDHPFIYYIQSAAGDVYFIGRFSNGSN